MTNPLNINLIIPFKDNKGLRLKLYVGDIKTFKLQLEERVDELRSELDSLFAGKCKLTIASRADGNAKKFFWRFRSRDADRKYHRVTAEPVMEYLSTVHDAQMLRVREQEMELIYINANLKLLKGMMDSIEQSAEEIKALISAPRYVHSKI